MPAIALALNPSGSPVLLGFTYALLHIVGPDHLGTIVALSVTAAAPRQAFYLGVSWSLGHCIGMLIVAAVVASIQTVVKVDVEFLDHVGAYFIGASLVGCGTYFLLHEQDYLEERTDGSVSLKSCACSHPTSDEQETGAAGSLNRGAGEASEADRPRSSEGLSREEAPGAATQSSGDQHYGSCSHHLVAPTGASSSNQPAPSALAHSGTNLRGALLGIAQGMCCPMGLVGIVMLTELSPMQIVLFMFIFLSVSAIGMGAAAAAWMWCTAMEGSHRLLSSRSLFRLSCAVTISLGGAWIVANYSGQLDNLEHSMHSMPAGKL